MKIEKPESKLSDKYKILPAAEMTLEEEAKWLALCNGLKFINNMSQLTGIEVDEKDISHGELLTYINNVSGDIRTCIKEKGGIPYKYSLTGSMEEAKNTEELTYEFLDQ
jgi:hypothetical protein